MWWHDDVWCEFALDNYGHNYINDGLCTCIKISEWTDRSEVAAGDNRSAKIQDLVEMW